jgi:hypothetical protein
MNTEQDPEYTAYLDRVRERCAPMFTRSTGECYIGEIGNVNRGWWPIVESLCYNIQSHIDQRKEYADWYASQPAGTQYKIKEPALCPQVTVQQIKEKFGGLRFYYSGGDETVAGMVRMAESWAARSCEVCGNPGEVRHTGWFRTLCAEHAAEELIASAERSFSTTKVV